jgi:ribosomal protein L11 methylase PrmA
MTGADERTGASFRDPSGFIFMRDGVLYRQVNQAYRKVYDRLMTGGLYEALTSRRLLIPHDEVEVQPADAALAYKVIRPQAVPFISYPYEWCFSQLKDAALLTLAAARIGLEQGMVLKDASAYNVQFVDGRPLLIDTLSFDLYKEGAPWDAYRQFCQHFLAPLALGALVDIRLLQLMRVYIDGIPLDLASGLLPGKTKLGLAGLAVHIHLHAKAQQQYSDKQAAQARAVKLSKAGLLNILDGLEKTIQPLKWEPKGTEWGDYYNCTNYSDDALKTKAEIVGRFVEKIDPKTAWDLGANNGLFSRELSRRGAQTFASDVDPAAVEQDYLAVKANHESNLLPVVIDLTNPSPALGWAHRERESLLERGPVDLVMALALIHHLAISNNVPLGSVAQFFAAAARWAIVEFVPKSDSQVQRLLASRKDIFDQYSEAGFEAAFGLYFNIVEKTPIPGSERVLYLFNRK